MAQKTSEKMFSLINGQGKQNYNKTSTHEHGKKSVSNVSKCWQGPGATGLQEEDYDLRGPTGGAGELGRRKPDTYHVRPHILLPTCHSSGLTIISPKKNQRQNAGAGSFTQELEYRAKREREPGKASRSVLLSHNRGSLGTL